MSNTHSTNVPNVWPEATPRIALTVDLCSRPTACNGGGVLSSWLASSSVCSSSSPDF